MSDYENRPTKPEDEWPHCKICGEKCFSNPGAECSECNMYPLCNWCVIKKNCCREKILLNPKWGDDKEFSKPAITITESLKKVE